MYTARRVVTIRHIWVIGGLLLSLAVQAWGHVDLEPRQSIPRKWQTYTLSVPSETQTPTVRIHLRVPAAFEIEAVKHSPPWQIDTIRDERGFIREVNWTGGSIPPQTFDELTFLTRNPDAAGLYRWQIEQYYQGEGAPAVWEAQTEIVALETTVSQRAEAAWRSAQVATSVSLVAIGISLTLILVTLVGLIQVGKRPRGGDDV